MLSLFPGCRHFFAPKTRLGLVCFFPLYCGNLFILPSCHQYAIFLKAKVWLHQHWAPMHHVYLPPSSWIVFVLT